MSRAPRTAPSLYCACIQRSQLTRTPASARAVSAIVARSSGSLPAVTVTEPSLPIRSERDTLPARTMADREEWGKELAPGAVVVSADPSESERHRTKCAFEALGCTVHGVAEAVRYRRELPGLMPDLVILELRLLDGPSLHLIEWTKAALPATRVVVLTAHGSLATAIHCARIGADGYLCKPATASAVWRAAQHELDEIEPSPREQPTRLDRALWEYINRAVQTTGSITEAARALGLDRRSLRRMLAKNAPTQ
jgi:two-component system response regulator RegA